jgi:23S rRNA A2030 N6-methylase RlmJ
MISIMLRWYYVVWFMCVDNENYKHQHKNTQQSLMQNLLNIKNYVKKNPWKSKLKK